MVLNKMDFDFQEEGQHGYLLFCLRERQQGCLICEGLGWYQALSRLGRYTEMVRHCLKKRILKTELIQSNGLGGYWLWLCCSTEILLHVVGAVTLWHHCRTTSATTSGFFVRLQWCCLPAHVFSVWLFLIFSLFFSTHLSEKCNLYLKSLQTQFLFANQL